MSNKVIYPIAFGVLLIYFYHLFQYTIDFPLADDYDSILSFLNKYINSNSFEDVAKLLFRFHNEHIILLTRLITIGQFELFGHVDLRLFCYFGAMGSFAMGGIYYANIHKKETHALSTVLILLITFSPLFAITNWAMSSVQNLYVLITAFATFHFLQYKTLKTTLLSGICQFLATFSIGGGFASFFVGLFMLKSHKRNHKIIWLSIGLFNLLLFFYLRYHHPSFKPLHPVGFHNILDFILFFFYFLGSAFNSIVSSQIGIIGIGAVVFLMILWHFFRKEKIFDFSPIEAFLIFLLLTAGLGTIARFGSGIQAAGPPRYQPIHLNLLLCLLLIYLNKDWNTWINSKFFQWGFLILALLFYGSRLEKNHRQIQNRHNGLIRAIVGFENGNLNAIIYPAGSGKTARGELHQKFLKQGYVKKNYSLQALLNIESTDIALIDSYKNINEDKHAISYKVNKQSPKNSIVIKNKTLQIHGWCINQTQKERVNSLYIALDSTLYPIDYGFERLDLVKRYKTPNVLKSGFRGHISLEDRPNGMYKLKFCVVNHHTKTKQFLPKEIQFEYQGNEK